jgi:hypothetical protein
VNNRMFLRRVCILLSIIAAAHERQAMTIPLAGTFEYVGVVPANPRESLSPWPLQLREPVEHTGNPLSNNRMLGYSPTLQITDGGLAPGEAPRLEIRRSRLTLTASGRRNAQLAAASFYVDRELTRAFNPGDTLHLARTHCCGLGLSLFRNGRLVLAVGAISAVPRGDNIQLSSPHDLIQQMNSLFQQRDPTFELNEYPLEISVDGQVRILFRGLRQCGDYNVWVLHGFVPGFPGTNESVAISLRGVAGPAYAPATRSARWMEDELEMRGW